MSLSNESNPQVAVIPLGSLATDDVQVPAIHFRKAVKILSVKLVNGAAITASDTNFVQVGLQHVGGNVIAEIDTRAAHENALVKNVGKALNVSAVEDDVAAGSNLEVDYQEGGTIALTSAVLLIEYFNK